MNKPNLPPVILSKGDHKRLQMIARSLSEQSHPLAAALLQELGRAELREPDDIPEGIVGLDRLVTYTTEGAQRVERRFLVHPEDRMWPPVEISVTTPVGITLLGLSAGRRMPMIGGALREPPPWVEVIAVGRSATSGLVRRPTFARESPRSLAH
jgi:regulator of nucleoside diphosphate kinase